MMNDLLKEIAAGALWLAGIIAALTAIARAASESFKAVTERVRAKIARERAQEEAAQRVILAADKWDDAARQVQANVVRLERIEGATKRIESEVKVNGGDTIKDRIIRHQALGDERHMALDDRLDTIEAHLRIQEEGIEFLKEAHSRDEDT